jgi:hypothetical protein
VSRDERRLEEAAGLLGLSAADRARLAAMLPDQDAKGQADNDPARRPSRGGAIPQPLRRVEKEHFAMSYSLTHRT